MTDVRSKDDVAKMLKDVLKTNDGWEASGRML